MDNIYLCTTCNANWSEGKFSADCPECGGGAMERNCFICSGRCDGIYTRAVIDSWDSGEAHWIGSCRLPPEEKEKYVLKLIAEQAE